MIFGDKYNGVREKVKQGLRGKINCFPALIMHSVLKMKVLCILCLEKAFAELNPD